VEALVQGKQAITAKVRVSPNQKIRQQAPWAGISLLSATPSVSLESPTCRAPYLLIEIPIDRYPVFIKERIDERFGTAGSGGEFRKDRRGNHETAPPEGRFQSGFRGVA